MLKEEPDWTALPADTPPPIRRLLRRCLEKDRRRRLADAADARLEIDEALAASGEPGIVNVRAPHHVAARVAVGTGRRARSRARDQRRGGHRTA